MECRGRASIRLMEGPGWGRLAGVHVEPAAEAEDPDNDHAQRVLTALSRTLAARGHERPSIGWPPTRDGRPRRLGWLGSRPPTRGRPWSPVAAPAAGRHRPASSGPTRARYGMSRSTVQPSRRWATQRSLSPSAVMPMSLLGRSVLRAAVLVADDVVDGLCGDASVGDDVGVCAVTDVAAVGCAPPPLEEPDVTFDEDLVVGELHAR